MLGVVAVGYNGCVENPFVDVRAALFDLDGTLIDTHIDFPYMRAEMLRFARESGIDVAGWEGMDILAIVERARELIAAREGQDAGSAFRKRAFWLLEEIEVSHCANPVEVEGARQLLARLSGNGVAVGIVTRNCRRVAERLVREGQLEHQVLFTRDDVPLTKPNPAHLISALAAMGLEPIHGALQHAGVMVGDHWMDVQGGRAAGMRTVGLLRGRESGFFAPAIPDLLVHELADLLPLVAWSH